MLKIGPYCWSCASRHFPLQFRLMFYLTGSSRPLPPSLTPSLFVFSFFFLHRCPRLPQFFFFSPPFCLSPHLRSAAESHSHSELLEWGMLGVNLPEGSARPLFVRRRLIRVQRQALREISFRLEPVIKRLALVIVCDLQDLRVKISWDALSPVMCRLID